MIVDINQVLHMCLIIETYIKVRKDKEVTINHDECLMNPHAFVKLQKAYNIALNYFNETY